MSKSSLQQVRKAVAKSHSTQLHSNQYLRPTAAAIAVATCFTGSLALANPTAPTVVNGTASFATAGNILNITNSHNAIINWGSFSIGINELTKFIQPSALSAVLNRVTGQDPSAILGALQSNGRVFLVNPNGIVFGAGAQIDVAGLVASTLNLSNEDFLNNRMRFTDGAGAGSVVNQGNISSGSVYLVGNAVTNDGLITSPNGEVVLAAGNSVELVSPGTPNLRVEIVAPDNEARNLGTITADAGRIGIYAGLINNSGTLNASSAVAEGGRIMLKASKNATLAAGSVLDVSGVGGGRIDVLADDTVYVDGRLDASAPSSGDGGFIETSGKNRVKIAPSAVVTTLAPQGQNGMYLVDPGEYIIAPAYGGDIDGLTVGSILNSTNFTISSLDGYGGGVSGDILVNDNVSWNSANTLTLTAERNVQVNNSIINAGTGNIKLNGGWNGAGDPNAPTLNNASGGVNLSAAVSTGGNVLLAAGGNITQGASGSITAVGLKAVSNSGAVNLAHLSATNMVNVVAGSAKGQFAFRNNGALEIGAVDGVSGITVNGFGSGAHATVTVDVIGGPLTVTQNISAIGGGSGGEGAQAGGNAVIALTSNGGIAVNSGATVQARGGSGGYGSSSEGGVGGMASVALNNTGAASNLQINSGATVRSDGGEGGYGSYSDGGAGGNAVLMLLSSGGLNVNGDVQSHGGSGGYAGSTISGNGGRGGNATVTLNAAGALTVGGYIAARGASGSRGGSGSSESSGGNGGRGGDGKVMLTAGGNLTVNGQIDVYGGSGGYGYGYYGGGVGGRGGDATVELTSTGNTSISGDVHAGGGWGAGDGGDGGNATVKVTSASSLAVGAAYGGNISADGGEGAWGSTTSGSATIALKAAGPITISNSSYINASGGSGSSGTRGGDGQVTVQSTGSSVTIDNNSSIYARGGDAYYYNSAAGGAGKVEITSAGATSLTDSLVEAYGGDGGEGQTGGAATVTLVAGGGLNVTNTNLEAFGGSGGSSGGKGGAAAVSLNATGGSIQMEGGEGAAWGGSGPTTGNAAVTLFSAGGIALNNSANLFAYANSGNSPGSALVLLAAAGNVALNSGSEVYSSGGIGLGGVNITMDNAYAYSDGGTVVTATGNFSVLNDSNLSSSGILNIGTGGNVLVDNSWLGGNPDVVLTVRGTINLNNGGTINAAVPTTIYATFPTLTSGGYFVNGIEGVVFDSVTGTGFRADNSPAILGTNFLVTYGGGSLTVPTDALIVAMGESTKPPDPEKDKDVFKEVEDDKKDAPVCR